MDATTFFLNVVPSRHSSTLPLGSLKRHGLCYLNLQSVWSTEAECRNPQKPTSSSRRSSRYNARGPQVFSELDLNRAC
jgi:hypothetical protein